ncbi:MAG: tetratricopeptide repeat protein [Bacteroidales bacterium]
MKKFSLRVVGLFFLISCGTGGTTNEILPDVPEGAEALSVTGSPLYAPVAPAAYKEKFRAAKEEWEADVTNANKLIWYGRWAAYCGDYREAIRIFTEGINSFPEDARMLRHRGHRYISIREFEKAVADFEKAAGLVSGQPDEVEPDGMPNPLNIPVSTLQSNIFYHLGLARYLLGDLEGALEAWKSDMAMNVNDDMTVATLHWIYMALRELGRNEEAMASLGVVSSDMRVIENQAYHRLCMFYKGEMTLEELTDGTGQSEIMNDAMLFGLGNWFLYNGDKDSAQNHFNQIIEGGSWASFGYIAAEVKLAGF